MHSSTSNSDDHATLWTATWMLARASWPTVLVAAGIVISAGVFSPRREHEAAFSTESIIVEGQLQRAATAGRADVVITGDSSALMGIVAPRLASRLGSSVESFATLGWVGPYANAELARSFIARNGRIHTLLVMYNPSSLSFSDADYAGLHYEAVVLGRGSTRNVLVRGRNTLFADAVERAVDFPLRGTFARLYGWPDTLASRLREWHGSIIDPNGPLESHDRAEHFTVHPAVLARFRHAAERLASQPIDRVCFGITPVPAALYDDETSRSVARAYEVIMAALRLPPSSRLDVPAVMPTSEFATHTHLNAHGRERYTDMVSAALAECSGRFEPEPAR